MKRKYFSLEKSGQTATINIYGDITSWEWLDSDISAATLSKQLESLGDVNEIDVFINSYGGEVAEGLAIYNSLKRHKAKIRTFCDGFAASIASVIFMAGDERIMNEASLLMIHNAWTYAAGDSKALRKQADDLEKITQASVEAYKAHSSLSEEEIKALMDNETWILPSEALEYGFATKIEKTENENASQHAFLQLYNIIKAYQEGEEEEPETDEPEADEPEEKPENAEGDEPEKPEEEPTTDDSTDEGEEEPEENPDDNENSEGGSNNDDENATQKWSGFFNAILKM